MVIVSLSAASLQCTLASYCQHNSQTLMPGNTPSSHLPSKRITICWMTCHHLFLPQFCQTPVGINQGHLSGRPTEGDGSTLSTNQLIIKVCRHVIHSQRMSLYLLKKKVNVSARRTVVTAWMNIISETA